MYKYKRIVVKIGTSVLTGGTHSLDTKHMTELVRQCVILYQQGHEVAICTSGAVAVGSSQLGFPDLPKTIISKQLFASVGQSRLMNVWEKLFAPYNIHVGQVLLTRADVEDRQRYLNARDTLSALLKHRIVPIINENDAVAPEEIKVGDNDNLSALVATLCHADLLMLLTDQTGLFTADPRTNPDAELIPEVRKIDAELRAKAGGSVSGLGVGGMDTKLQAANIARHVGTDVIIAAGHAKDIIIRGAQGEAEGTLFPALVTGVEGRKEWILAGPKSAGILVVDAGAAKALCENGKSLLAAGIRWVKDSFQRGDTVLIVDEEDQQLARGITAYSSEDLQKIKGCQSAEISKRLGHHYGASVVHRNDLILLTD
ncbi:MAG: glutamate 5-kinase [Chloroflexota bacterium]